MMPFGTFRLTRLRLALAILTGLSAPTGAESGAAPLGAVEAPDLRVVKTVSGTRGVQKGSLYEIQDPRTVFSLPADRQVVVSFEWEGAPGRYHFEGWWKDPTGAVVLRAPIDYEAVSRRFGIYWTLALPETVATGLWALEVHVGGALAGTHSFQIVAGPGSKGESLTPAQLYERAVAGVAALERVGASGEPPGPVVGVALDGERLLTAFSSIEGATALRLGGPSGRRLEITDVRAWSRREGWAILGAPSHGRTPLPHAAKPVGIGDRVFVLDSGADGSWVIGEGTVVGRGGRGTGRTLKLQEAFSAGSPVLTEAGELVGIIADGGPVAQLGEQGVRVMGSLGIWLPRSDTVLPLEMAQAPAGGAPASLAELGARGVFIKPLSPERRHVISGVFAGHVERGGVVPMPYDQKLSFSHADGSFSVFVQWSPQAKLDAQGSFELYDSDNKRIVRGQPTKLKLRPRELFFTTWIVRCSALPPGVYRVDALLDGAPVWRGYVQITE
jgi:Trypsin-like peptidase domain